MRSKLIALIGFFMFTAMTGRIFASELQESPADERMGVSFHHLKICHQHAWRNLDVHVTFAGDEILSVNEVKEHVRAFLAAYPNEDDFWEVMNLNLVRSLSDAFPQIAILESTFSLSPDVTLSFPRASYIIHDRDAGTIKEAFSFTKLSYLICQETFRSLDMFVYFDLKDNPAPSDYPDYPWVDDAMKEFFADHPVSLSRWKTLSPELEAYILARFPSLTHVSVQIVSAK